MKPFISQDVTYVPERRRSKSPSFPKKRARGRPRSYLTLDRFFFQRKLFLVRNSGKRYSREEFAAALGMEPRAVNTMSAAFIPHTPEENEQQQELQKSIDKNFCNDQNVTAVPLFSQQEILQRDFSMKNFSEESEISLMAKEPRYGSKMYYFALIMPDNCMLHDGICKGDKIIAVRNVRPGHGDLVVCRIPGVDVITVRRFAKICNPQLFDLYEGGSTNPFIGTEIEDMIYGVVVNVERSYWPSRMPQPWEPLR